jgi:Flp pilus assembly protein TadG
MKILKEEQGNILILTALCMTMLISFMAMAVDVGNLYYTKCKLQTLADAAAMAGALEVDTCIAAGQLNCSAMQTAAKSALTENGISATESGVLLTINNGPSALAGDPNTGSKYYVEAVVTKEVPTYFAKIFGKDTATVSARAEAGKSKPSGSGIITNNLTLNSGASITDAQGSTSGIYDNGDSTEDAGATVNVGSYTVHGTVHCNSCSNISPTPTSGPQVPDPFASLTAPSHGTTQSSNNESLSRATELKPGYYSGGLNFNGGTYTVTLDPGVYYMDGTIKIGAGVTITGTGVTIYMASGQLIMDPSTTANLTAPTSAVGNCASCAGMLIWQAPGNLNQMILNSGPNATWGGAIYAPKAELVLNGGSNLATYGTIYANSLMVNSTITLSGSGGHNGSLTIALAE